MLESLIHVAPHSVAGELLNPRPLLAVSCAPRHGDRIRHLAHSRRNRFNPITPNIPAATSNIVDGSGTTVALENSALNSPSIVGFWLAKYQSHDVGWSAHSAKVN